MCARCKRPGLRMAGFRKFQQTYCITHKVFIAVEVCTPSIPFTQDLLMIQWAARPRVPKRSATIYQLFSNAPLYVIIEYQCVTDDEGVIKLQSRPVINWEQTINCRNVGSLQWYENSPSSWGNGLLKSLRGGRREVGVQCQARTSLW